MSQTVSPIVEAFFDEATYTITYVVQDQSSEYCAIIDPVLDFDAKSGRTSTTSAERVIEFINSRQLKVDWILETHAHADHLSAAQFLKRNLRLPDSDRRKYHRSTENF